MKLTKQTLIKLIKEVLLQEDYHNALSEAWEPDVFDSPWYERDDQPPLPSDMSVPDRMTYVGRDLEVRPFPDHYSTDEELAHHFAASGPDPSHMIRNQGADPLEVYKQLGFLPWNVGTPVYADGGRGWTYQRKGESPVSFEEPGFERYRDAVKAGVATGYDPHNLPRIPLAKTLEENTLVENDGYHPSWEAALGYDPYDRPPEDWATQMEERAANMRVPWADALAVADTGWGPGSLEESIQTKLKTLLKK